MCAMFTILWNVSCSSFSRHVNIIVSNLQYKAVKDVYFVTYVYFATLTAKLYVQTLNLFTFKKSHNSIKIYIIKKIIFYIYKEKNILILHSGSYIMHDL